MGADVACAWARVSTSDLGPPSRDVADKASTLPNVRLHLRDGRSEPIEPPVAQLLQILPPPVRFRLEALPLGAKRLG